jgi:hypothetical protein
MVILRKSGGRISSRVILDAIEKGNDIFLENVSVDGNLDLSQLSLPELIVNNIRCQKKYNLKSSARIITSSIRIVNCRIIGSVNFSSSLFLKSINFKKTQFEKSVSFAGSKFAEDVNFAGAVFLGEEPTNFLCTIFDRNIYFDGALIKDFIANNSTFYAIASFWGTKFEVSNFIECEFYGETRFMGAIFGGYSTFDSAKFIDLTNFRTGASSIDFSNAKFAKGAHFGDAQFRKSVVFIWAQFISHNQFINAAYFVGAKFHSRATFEEVLFDGVAHFGYATFFDDVDFKLAKFRDDVDFGDSRFYGHAKFQRVRFNESAYFMNASFWRNLVLTGARGYEMRLKNATFHGGSCISHSYAQISEKIRELESVLACPWDEKCSWKKAHLWSKSCIMLDDSAIFHLYVKWDNIKNHIAYDSASYLALTKNFRDLGEFLEADLCYYQFRELERKKKNINMSKIINMFENFYYGYGVYPFRAIPASFIIICIFTALYCLGNQTCNLQTIGANLYNSTVIFTANSKSIEWDYWYLNTLSLVEGLLGWLLMALFLVTLGRNRPR